MRFELEARKTAAEASGAAAEAEVLREANRALRERLEVTAEVPAFRPSRWQAAAPVLLVVAGVTGGTGVALGVAVTLAPISGRASPDKTDRSEAVGSASGEQPVRGPIVWQKAEPGLLGATMNKVRAHIGAPTAIRNDWFGFGTELHDASRKCQWPKELLVANCYEGSVVEVFRRDR